MSSPIYNVDADGGEVKITVEHLIKFKDCGLPTDQELFHEAFTKKESVGFYNGAKWLRDKIIVEMIKQTSKL